MQSFMRIFCIVVALLAFAGAAQAAGNIVLISTDFVLENKFKQMADSASETGIEFSWAQVDGAGADSARNLIAQADFVIIDAPRADDRGKIEATVGDLLRDATMPVVRISVMSPGDRLQGIRLEAAQTQRLFDYYVNGTRINQANMFAWLSALLDGGDAAAVAAPMPMPNGGIYHPAWPAQVFATSGDYLDWWTDYSGKDAREVPVIAMEASSSYISDGQNRMLDDSIAAIEARGALPLVFYRSSRAARAESNSRAEADDSANAIRAGRPAATQESGPAPSAEAALTVDAGNAELFPNPKPVRTVQIDEPLLMDGDRLLPDVMIVNTFIGGDPESRKAWHQAMDIPVLLVLRYAAGGAAVYAEDHAGVDSFSLPNTLTQAEYIGMQDPVLLTVNENGVHTPLPEQMDLLMGKAMALATLRHKSNDAKHVALFFWNHPPGERNGGASNLNVPRSVESLVARLREQGYDFDAVSEQSLIDAIAMMQRPRYRDEGLAELMRTELWDFLPLSDYQQWFATLPDSVQDEVRGYWGEPEASPWLADKDGVRGFVIPRLKLGKLIFMPQPARGERSSDEEEAKLFHDVKIPLSHSYMATYLWVRQYFAADAIIHFGTHGSQEWTPGKERGLWAYDYPQILVGNTPVIYPYIVDNIGEAIHVKRRGRGVIVSHQTPAFAPAGLSSELVAINDSVREYLALDLGPVKDGARQRIIEQAQALRIDQDLGLTREDFDTDFDAALRKVQDQLETLGSAMQPLGLHTFGQDIEREHRISNVMQMLGTALYSELGLGDGSEIFQADYSTLQHTAPWQFVDEWVMRERPLDELNDPELRALAEKGRQYAEDLAAHWESDAVIAGLSARWVDPSYGGDPIRNPDALHTGRNVYGFDPSRVPTPSAYEAGAKAMAELIETHAQTKGSAPTKLAFTMWSSETMRHLGMLEGQILAAMGVRPIWNEGGQVVGIEVIPAAELGRPRIDPVISLTGLYRDQFPTMMERFNEAILLVAALDEPPEINPIRANSQRIESELLAQGVPAAQARSMSLTRVYGTESGNYGTGLTDATLRSDQWEENDGQLAAGYLMRMSWAYGPDKENWSTKAADGEGREVNAYAAHLAGTDAVVFSRSSNLRGLLDNDHPFEYLGGLSLAVRAIDGESPQLYISNMRDPQRAKLDTAEHFMATELRAVYQHPRWAAEMKEEGYSGTLKMLDVVNNFWGWQAMDRNIVRDDQWQEFNEIYVKDRYNLGLREWFEQNNPAALAQITERMLEA
ncbi:MAG: cobaltochelatase subunit CobN, partial [Pseudomonadales bacterium]|nr:cobaltochelatase subunit CobN [Pseudomonadales bacterium]